MKFIRSSSPKATTPKTVGRLLRVDLPLFGIEGVLAKVDTGAFSGALHATDIREITDESGAKRLCFLPLGGAEQALTADSFHKRRVKSSNGVVSTRYAIETEIKILGQLYPITITLTNRDSMNYPILIGYNFLSSHGFIIDASNDNR